jgi:hypothetical protein
MGKLKSFAEFINENYQLNEAKSLVVKRKRFNVSENDGQVYLVVPNSNIVWVTGDDRPEAEKMNYEAASRLFKIIATSEHSATDVDIDHSMPIIYYSGSGVNGVNWVKNKDIKDENLYNKPEGMKISANKVDFQKLFGTEAFMPKAVFTKAKAKDLTFPIVAKIADGHSGQGIVKFKNYEALKKSTDKFDLYMEYVDFVTEYRCVFCKDELIAINERVPVEEDNKTIDNMKYDEKVSFCYVDQDIDKVPFASQVEEMARTIRGKLAIDLYSVDVVLDKDDKVWCLEVNTATGIGASKMALIYMKIYEQHYGKKLPAAYKKELTDRYIKTGNSLNYPSRAKEIAKSKYAIDYKANTLPIPEEWKDKKD